jgi:hypothetical protein
VNRRVSFWLALAVGFASAIASGICFTVAYYTGRQPLSLEDFQAFFDSLPSGNVEARFEVPGKDSSALPWWIAGGMCTALAVASLAFAVLRRPRLA